MIFTEENGYYQIDCNKALWATDEHHQMYLDDTASLLSDVDWIIETKDRILFVEYKNGTVYSSGQSFNPCDEKTVNKVSEKYYDSLHYLKLMQKEKPVDYIFVLEFPDDDAVTRKILRNKISKKLPFRLQKRFDKGKLINDFSIVSIDEWNKSHPEMPISRTDKPFKQNKV
ncbi:hypothetical protein [Ruminococcus sp. HUN007]|uniref:hypothetical protein n=1 Tax=Ruminococcus sp. HUN007 TaxID=1514668 RepID=UPI000679467B|nr:hypothetical protein [Ruminococcus sp. HUN007]